MSALRFSTVVHRGALRVAGEDRVGFLQGLISNDVTRVSPTQAIYAALLTPQGRFQWDMFIVGTGDVLLLDVERDRAADLAKKLGIYKLRSKVVLENPGDSVEIVVAYGPDAAAALGLPPTAGAAKAIDDAIVYVDPRLPALGVRVVAPDGHAAALLAAQGFTPAPLDAYEALRLSLGVPDGSRDLPVDKALLLENGFDELNGVDWNKGCYMGQELTARTKYRGLVRKRLLPVAVEGPLPAAGTLVMLDDQEAGEMRSGVAGRALALLRLEAVDKVAAGGGTLTAGDTRLTPLLPEWLKRPEPAA
ncbi:folate-binding protein YgfZ [Reyranella sp. CPCC 100927]|uniref:CAF17-like 4Fe-4S cluster assembly/insertion protein YgfZ n=1 Tax=Reyranella sp. CPCC 100927 TaxID=2599616 RepID=UPI0011B37AD9|nr:folate-binding protein YgfZ [Reyranella sp. CPCC 100927]TWT04052.1 folate-binding protein YgfZ [Reyranella sp. CPCC 100927]